jgi:hypothetical protein
MQSSRPPARVSTRRDRKRTDQAHVRWDAHEDRALIDATQRAVARGRHAIVRARGRVLQFRDDSRTTVDLAPRALATLHRRLAQLGAVVDRIHGRLLSLSASVEKENDRLDIVLGEIERLSDLGRTRGGAR